ncbi:MAG: hypothetical protein KKB82_03440 [Candidatus Omnitrophica bacterium]|nr:hypothetical protein [Candidatus Omnitrophota bacterium]MBU1924960.1 hypothetical protein [Candidatus Omnitrophota bacterium]
MTRVFRKINIEKEKLEELILKNPESLEADISFIDHHLGCEEEGIIDFLAVDRSGRLVIVNFDVRDISESLLICAISQMHWLKKNECLIKRIFSKEGVDFEKTPLLLVLCPDFSQKARSAAKEFTAADIKFIKYTYIANAEEDAVFFEEIFSSTAKVSPGPVIRSGTHIPRETIQTGKSSAEGKMPLQIAEETEPGTVPLSREEIAEFMEFDAAAGIISSQ